MRLTEKMCNGEYLHSEASGYSTEICLDKLGQLEDIEEELGIELLKLIEICKAEKVFLFGYTEIIESSSFAINIYDKTISISNGVTMCVYPLSEYGKSFALTKEELKNERI